LDLQLKGKSAIITGSSKGLGLASAKALVAEGCRVCICARGTEALDRAAAELRKIGGEGMVVRVAVDLTAGDGPQKVVGAALEAFGGVDILINNVAAAKGAGIADTPDAEWHQALDHTLFPAIRMSRLVVPHMQTRGGGSILIIASIWGRESGGRMTYNAVKAAEISLAKSMAQQLAKDNIRVNSLAPGSILFPGGSWDQRQKADPEGIADFVRRELPFGRFGRAEEVAAAVAFLSSPLASWISGSCVTVDGCQSRSQI
jgi:3-oxoacyl-[acyl-carrier protein] reductase